MKKCFLVIFFLKFNFSAIIFFANNEFFIHAFILWQLLQLCSPNLTLILCVCAALKLQIRTNQVSSGPKIYLQKIKYQFLLINNVVYHEFKNLLQETLINAVYNAVGSDPSAT